MKELHKNFKILRQHVILLAIEWKFYNDLFGDTNNAKVLSKTASYFYRHLQVILIDTIILKLNKLLELRKTGRNNLNLTIDYLIYNIQEQKLTSDYYICGYNSKEKYFFLSPYKLPYLNSNIVTRIKKIIFWSNEPLGSENIFKNIKEEFEKLSDYRNKFLAHLDLPTQVQQTNLLPQETYFILNGVIKKIYILINKLELVLFDTNTVYDQIIIENGTNSLVMNSIRALRYKELLKNGDIDSLDLVLNFERLKKGETNV